MSFPPLSGLSVLVGTHSGRIPHRQGCHPWRGGALSTGCRPVVLLAFGLRAGSAG